MSRIAKAIVLDGPMNTEAFRASVGQVLVPTLRPGDVVVMDDLPAYKSAAVRTMVEAAGAALRYLPPYCRTSTRSRTRSPS